MNNDDLVERDLKVLWHPCSQMKDHEWLPMTPIRRGRGAWLEDFDGKRYLDAISSWWVNIFGHSNPVINAAIADQLKSLEHVILAGFTHEPVIRLSERLVDITPAGQELHHRIEALVVPRGRPAVRVNDHRQRTGLRGPRQVAGNRARLWPRS